MFLLLAQVTPCLSSYDATALAMIKPRKDQRLPDPMLQFGVVTRNSGA